MNRITKYLFFICIVFPVYMFGEIDPDIDPLTLHLKEAYATRITKPPQIDGILDEPVWQKAISVTDWLQTEPDNLARPTEKTEVRILYDDNNLYVGFRVWDSEPDKITKRLARRDSWVEAAADNADWISIALDSRNDNRTGYAFIVNAAGVKVDAYIYNDDNYDLSWDSVWDGIVHHDKEGWMVEFRLPFFLFKFDGNSDQEWGLELNRMIQRKQEWHEWPAKLRGVKGVVSRFGILKGIKNIPSPKQVEMLPYILGGYHINNEKQITQNGGLDVKYGITSNATLNISFNPDFGQVEADPSVLNLTAFETFYEEKRLFFVEDGSFFKNRIQLFHSRRIGKNPGYYSPSKGNIIDRPNATTILGAAKLTGKTDSGFAFGFVEGITDEEYGVWQYPTDEITSIDSVFDGDSFSKLDTNFVQTKKDYLLEPETNYFVGRVENPIINDLSTIGFLVTNVRRKSASGASSAGLDWNIRLMDNRFGFSGQAAISDTENGKGYAGRFYLGYKDPVWWELNIISYWSDDTFDINDLGFLERSGTFTLGTFGGVRKQDPWGPFLRNNINYNFFIRSRNDGLNLFKGFEVNQSNTTKNYWSFGIGGKIDFPSFNDDDTFKDSRAWEIAKPLNRIAWGWFQSDSRKSIVIFPMFGYGADDFGGSGYMAKLNLNVKPTDYFTISIDATHINFNSGIEWVGVDSDSLGDHIIYSDSKQITDDIQVRMNWTFSPDLSFQMFLQPFKVNMNYFAFKSLEAPKTLDFLPYDYQDDPDFKIDNLVGTFVLRWEYKLGSTLFIVYNLNDNNKFSSAEDSWNSYQSNTLFIKLNYWFHV